MRFPLIEVVKLIGTPFRYTFTTVLDNSPQQLTVPATQTVGDSVGDTEGFAVVGDLVGDSVGLTVGLVV